MVGVPRLRSESCLGAGLPYALKQVLAHRRPVSSAQGRGLCTKDMQGTLECREGTLVKTNSCRSCTVTGDQVICSP